MVGVEFEPADVLVFVRDRGLVLEEKSLVAFNTVSGKILALGTEAEGLVGSSWENVSVISPLRQGMVADYMVAVKLFSFLIRKAWRNLLRKPGVAVCAPKGMVEVEKKALTDVMYQAGAREVMFSDIPVEQFVREFQEKLPKEYRKFPVVVGITKHEPEGYVREQLCHVLEYAAQEGIAAERVAELMGEILEVKRNH